MKKDSRYQKTETAILTTLAKILQENPRSVSLNPSQLAQYSKISLSTFYRHYKTVDDIFNFYETKILKKFEVFVRCHSASQKSAKHAVRLTLIFIMKHQKLFSLSFARGDQYLTRYLFEFLEPKIGLIYRWPKTKGRLYDICFYEFYGILEEWSRRAFDEKELSLVASNIVYLFKSAPARLKGLVWHSWHASAKEL